MKIIKKLSLLMVMALATVENTLGNPIVSPAIPQNDALQKITALISSKELVQDCVAKLKDPQLMAGIGIAIGGFIVYDMAKDACAEYINKHKTTFIKGVKGVAFGASIAALYSPAKELYATYPRFMTGIAAVAAGRSAWSYLSTKFKENQTFLTTAFLTIAAIYTYNKFTEFYYQS